MKDWFIKNKSAMFVGGLTVAMAACFAFISGCNLGDLVTVKVPSGVQRVTNTSATIPLNEAEYAFESWAHFVESNTSQFQNNIERSNLIWGSISSAVNIGVDSAQGPLSALPGGAMLISGLTLLTGLLLDKPGSAKKLAQEKERSYNAGIKAGSDAVATAKSS
jgi:hypothetical protein